MLECLGFLYPSIVIRIVSLENNYSVKTDSMIFTATEPQTCPTRSWLDLLKFLLCLALILPDFIIGDKKNMNSNNRVVMQYLFTSCILDILLQKVVNRKRLLTSSFLTLFLVCYYIVTKYVCMNVTVKYFKQQEVIHNFTPLNSHTR